MPESNGSGRLDRIEALLEKVTEKLDRVATTGYLHDERISRLEANLEDWQQETIRLRQDAEEMRKQSLEREARIDDRIERLVIAIGEYVKRPVSPA